MKNLFSNNTSKKKVAIAITSLIVLATTLGIFINNATKKAVALTLDGKEKVIRTHADTVEDMFKKLKISVRKEDYVHPALATKIEDKIEVEWIPAKQVQMIQDSKEKIVWTTAKTVEELLEEQNIQLRKEDKIKPSITAPIGKDTAVHIQKAFPVELIDANKRKTVWSTSATVADLLSIAGVTLNELDRVEPNLKDPVKKDETVKVVRVEKVTDVVEESLNFAVVTKKDASLSKGKEKVVKKGKKGLVKKEYEVVLENGKEVSRKLLSEETVKDRQNKVVAVGTKNISNQVSRGSSTVATGKEFYVMSTAYTPYCNGCSGFTATGLNVKANPKMKVIAVDPRVIPLGTKVHVQGYGNAIAADTGSAIKGNKIDVLFPTKEEAYRWGKRKVKIKILK